MEPVPSLHLVFPNYALCFGSNFALDVSPTSKGDNLVPLIRLYQLILLIFSIPPQLSANTDRLQFKQSTISEVTGKAYFTAQDRDLELISITLPGKSERAHRFYAQASLHGNESYTTDFISWLSFQIRHEKSELNHLPDGSTIDLILVANPDSFKKSRFNKNGVNLNRNFGVLWGKSDEPFGSKAFSEPETKAIRALFDHYQYTAAVDIHGYLNWIVIPSQPQAIRQSVKKFAKANYKMWTQTLIENSSQLPNYFIKDAASLGDGGSFEDWAFWEKGVYAFCLEMRVPTRFMKTPNETIDLFRKYESYIANTFKQAAALKDKETLNANQENSDHSDNPKRVAAKND